MQAHSGRSLLRSASFSSSRLPAAGQKIIPCHGPCGFCSLSRRSSSPFPGAFTDTLFTVAYIPGTGWVYAPVLSSSVYLASGIYMIAIMLWATWATMVSWQRAEQEMTRRQNGLVCAASSAFLSAVPFRGILSPPGDLSPEPGLCRQHDLCDPDRYCNPAVRLILHEPRTVVPEILRTLPEGVILIDPAGKIVVANAAAGTILGVPVEDLPGQAITSFLPAGVCATLRSVLVTRDRSLIWRSSLPGGPVRSGVFPDPVSDPAGRLAGFVLIIRDISDRKAAEVSLKHANEKISILSQMTRHDVGNLLTALSGILTWSGKKYRPQNRILPCIGRRDHGEDLPPSPVLAGIPGDRVHEPAWQPLESLIERGIAAFPHEGIALTIHVDPVEIYTDPLAFKVMYNLFENQSGTAAMSPGLMSLQNGGPTGALLSSLRTMAKVSETTKKPGSSSSVRQPYRYRSLPCPGYPLNDRDHDCRDREPGKGARFELKYLLRHGGRSGSGPGSPAFACLPGYRVRNPDFCACGA